MPHHSLDGRVSTAVEMADALKAAIDAGKPSLLEVEVEATDGGTFEKWPYVTGNQGGKTGERKREAAAADSPK